MRSTAPSTSTTVRERRRQNCGFMHHWLLAIVMLFAPGCFNPSNWDKDRVAQDIKEQWSKYDITEVTLNPVTDGFEGTAKDSKGESFKIKLKKDSAKKSVSGTGVGDRGTELDYSVSAK